MSGGMTWDEFEQMLVSRGWPAAEAKQERETQEFGILGDCDGDADPWA